ncbi:MAG: C2H2-type zinc finger protein [Candidatus Micrarchaeota archaeon]|nr:C2H2-type zinc finger protein [Candidatus Micrarchaeota archaeon]
MEENKCEACGMGFRTHDKLMAHNRVAHVAGQEFKCKACGAGFGSQKELMDHNKKEHRM